MAEWDSFLAKQPRPWLLSGNVAVQFQAYRDLWGIERLDLQRRIAVEGDGAAILEAHAAARWGRGFYQPKWTCPHYSLLELRDLGIVRDNPDCTREVAVALDRHQGGDGGFNPFVSVADSDVCVNGMFLAYGCYFGADASGLESIVDFVLRMRMDDGGFNCLANRSGARVSSVHSTTSVVDGFSEYLKTGYAYRADDVRTAISTAAESLMGRGLYRRRSSDEPIHDEFLRLHHPARWHFDVLRGLDVLRGASLPYSDRLDDAVNIIRRRCGSDGRWSAARQYPGQTHIIYPSSREPNRWVTLRALRVLKWHNSAS